jgi:AhpD family alkylhydroperoxidase
MKQKIEVFDPPLCCPTGVCGPDVDPQLARFSADCDWLVNHGIEVTRYNLAQQPEAFAANEKVREVIRKEGPDCLPVVLVNEMIMSRGKYPSRKELAQWVNLTIKEEPRLYSEAVAELVAIGAAIAANCEPCFKAHFDRARKLGVSPEDMERAVATAQTVKEVPAQSILRLAERFLKQRQNTLELPIIQEGDGSSKKGCCS